MSYEEDVMDFGNDHFWNICKNEIIIDENETFLTHCGNSNGCGPHTDGMHLCYDCLLRGYEKKKKWINDWNDDYIKHIYHVLTL